MARRLRPNVATLALHERRGAFELDADLAGISRPTIAIDVYGYRSSVHPDRHLGWWRFPVPGDRAHLAVTLDFTTLDGGSVQATASGQPLPMDGFWTNPDYVFEPVQDLGVVLRNGADGIVDQAGLLLRETDRAVLARYAQHAHRIAAYGPKQPSAVQWILTFHRNKLHQLRRLFRQYIPAGGLVADVGAGRSLFTELVEWRLWPAIPYRLVCSDVATDTVTERRAAFPQTRWLAADAGSLPFTGGRFDAVFAGEVLEHLPDPAAALAEWARLLRPGGVLVVTTPNRKRLTNLLNNADTPMGPDHISELTYDECLELLAATGLQAVETCGLYLELDLQWRSRGPKVDLAPARPDIPGRGLALRLLNWLARPFPRYALDVIYVARKPFS